jgi:hypothetical protein
MITAILLLSSVVLGAWWWLRRKKNSPMQEQTDAVLAELLDDLAAIDAATLTGLSLTELGDILKRLSAEQAYVRALRGHSLLQLLVKASTESQDQHERLRQLGLDIHRLMLTLRDYIHIDFSALNSNKTPRVHWSKAFTAKALRFEKNQEPQAMEVVAVALLAAVFSLNFSPVQGLSALQHAKLALVAPMAQKILADRSAVTPMREPAMNQSSMLPPILRRDRER